MTDESRRFRLGLFTIAGVLLLMGGVIAIGAGRFFRKTDPLYCYFQESVQGLEPGSPVKFRGVEVGRVEEINVMPDARIAAKSDAPQSASLIEVRSSLFVDKISTQDMGLVDRAQIHASIVREVSQGLRVRIAWKDITGQKYLDLDYVDALKSPPAELPFAPPGTYIPTAVERSFSDIQRDVATVTSELARVDYQAIAADVRALLASLQARVDEMGSAGVGNRVGEAADAVRDLAKSPRVDQALTRLDGALARIESAATRADELLARPGVEAAVDDLAASAAAMRRVAAHFDEELPKLTASLNETLDLARRTIDESRLPETTTAARATMSDVGAAARQLGALRDSARRTLADLGEATRGLAQFAKYIEENPDALLHGKREEVR